MAGDRKDSKSKGPASSGIFTDSKDGLEGLTPPTLRRTRAGEDEWATYKAMDEEKPGSGFQEFVNRHKDDAGTTRYSIDELKKSYESGMEIAAKTTLRNR